MFSTTTFILLQSILALIQSTEHLNFQLVLILLYTMVENQIFLAKKKYKRKYYNLMLGLKALCISLVISNY